MRELLIHTHDARLLTSQLSGWVLSTAFAKVRTKCRRAPHSSSHLCTPEKFDRGVEAAVDRPRATALGRNWRRPFGTFPCWVYKKECGFGLLVSRRSRQRNSRCRPKRNKKLRKPGLMSPTEKPAQTRRIFLGDSFWSSRPEHNQKPPPDTANRHCALIPTRRKMAVSPQGGRMPPL